MYTVISYRHNPKGDSSGPFSTRRQAERFAEGLASSGQSAEVSIVGNEPDWSGVITSAAECASFHGAEVGRALTAFVASPSDTLAQTALRVALVAQASGHEGSAHDGSTHERRCSAARDAIAAWPEV